MAKIYENYNASYPASYYQVGSVYAFYGSGIENSEPAFKSYISGFSYALDEINEEESPNAIKPVGKTVTDNSNSKEYKHLQRFYAVVVRKGRDFIVVMFKHQSASGSISYLMKTYVVSAHCETDGKDLMPIRSSTSSAAAKSHPERKVGGVTKSIPAHSTENNNVGRITKAGEVQSANSGIGKITKMDNAAVTQENSAQAVSKVGGITRINKVGGITRIKK